MQTAAKPGFFDATDGLKLFAEWAQPPAGQKPRAVLVIAHGYGEHQGRYAKLAAELAAQGFAVMTFDYRGHGQAGGRRGHCDHFQEFLGDLDRAVAKARSTVPNVPVGLIGHSHGGLIVLRALCEPGRTPPGVTAAVLSAPFLALAMAVPKPKVVLAKVASRILPRLSQPNGIPAEHLSHDKQIVEAYGTDRWNHHVATVRWFTECSAAQAYVADNAAKLAVPTLWQLPGDDKIASTPTARRVFEAAGPGPAEKTLKVYDGLYHEIYNEISREGVVKDLSVWLSARFPAP